LSLRNANRYNFTERGATIPAYLWNVDRKVDLSPIQYQWASQWERWKCYTVSFEQMENETPEEFQARFQDAQRRITQTGRLPEDLRAQATPFRWEQEGLEQVHDTMFGSDSAGRNIGSAVTSMISADRVERDPGAQIMIGQIFVDILRYLYNSGEVALANSLWHSVRLDAVNKEKKPEFDHSHSKAKDLPDDVGDLLSDRETISDPWRMLQLDRNRRGTFNQVWVIDRIMRDGYLHVGHYVRSSKIAVEDKTELVMSQGAAGSSSGPQDEDSPKIERKGLLQDQLMKQLMASMFRARHDKEEGSHIRVTLGATVNFAYLLSAKLWSSEAEARRRQRVSAFDVDGPCLIATPFDSDLERLPHPEYRSMSLGWIIEPVDDNDVKEDEDLEADPSEEDRTEEDQLKRDQIEEDRITQEQDHAEEESRQQQHELVSASTMSEGEHPSTDSTDNLQGLPSSENSRQKGAAAVVDNTSSGMLSEKASQDGKGKGAQKNGATESAMNPESADEDQETPLDPEHRRHVQTFRVLSKVKGVWEIMEEPRWEYQFVEGTNVEAGKA
jgi:hypothetical protein